MSSKFWCLVWLHLTVELSAVSLIQECKSTSVPKLIYNLLKCEPQYGEDKCIIAYTCPNINRPKDTCHFQGKIYQIGERIDNELLSAIPFRECDCTPSGDFQCLRTLGDCRQYVDHEYPHPGCYLTAKLNTRCDDGEICPPFDGKTECKVNGRTYMEGQRFEVLDHEHCAMCVCEKGFDGKIEAPFCQTVNCPWSLLEGGKYFDKFCALYYADLYNSCCFDAWICPEAEDEHHTSPIPSTNPDWTCKFGNKTMGIGDYLIQTEYAPRIVKCECVVPPYLHCTSANP